MHLLIKLQHAMEYSMHSLFNYASLEENLQIVQVIKLSIIITNAKSNKTCAIFLFILVKHEYLDF
jgi:hypothetical protein